MDYSVRSLQNICISWLSSNLETVCEIHGEKHPTRQQTILKFRYQDVFLPEPVGNKLFRELNNKRYLTSLVMTLFDPNVIRLSAVRIYSGSCIGLDAMQILKRHKLKSVEIFDFDGLRLSDFSNFFSHSAFDNLIELSFCNSRLTDSCDDIQKTSLARKRWKCIRKFYPFWSPLCAKKEFISEKKSTYELKVNSSCCCKEVMLDLPENDYVLPKTVKCFSFSSSTIPTVSLLNYFKEFSELVKVDLSNINHLDSITFLIEFRRTLKYLFLYNTFVVHSSSIISTLLRLQKLCMLDISTSSSSRDSPINELISNPIFGPQLEGIDISGHDNLQEDSLSRFIKRHSKIKFIGMYRTSVDIRVDIDLPNCKFTSAANYSDLLESLIRYSTKRDMLLYVLEHICLKAQHPDAKLELYPYQPYVEHVQLCLNNFRRDMRVQITGFNIAALLIQPSFPEQLLAIIVNNLVEVIQCGRYRDFCDVHNMEFYTTAFIFLMEHQESFINNSKNMEAIIRSAFFVLSYSDQEVNRAAFQLVSTLFNKMSLSDASVFVQKENFVALQSTIHFDFYNRPVADIDEQFLKLALSVFWSLTDGSFSGCRMILDVISIPMLIKYCNTFPNRWKIQEKVLGILSNIAEINEFRKFLIVDDAFQIFIASLESDVLVVSVLAAFILSNLIISKKRLWKNVRFCKREVRKILSEAVLRWEVPEDEIIKYRSFRGFVNLLGSEPEVQLFALWLLKTVTSENRERYCEMLFEDGVLSNIMKIYKYPRNPNIKTFAQQILNILVEYYKLSDINVLLNRIDSSKKIFHFPDFWKWLHSNEDCQG